MGYKLAGYDVIGNCEIDPDMMNIYRRNLHPRVSYLLDVRELLSQDLPDEMHNLDILDGSPPCSVFSVAGKREAKWGIESVFREGQVKQTLDDLFFAFIDIARELRPKAVIAENVTGLLKGNARGYVNEIIKRFREAGYRVQIFAINAARLGVPQRRERVFFICSRDDLSLPKLKLEFNEPLIPFGEVRSERGVSIDGTLYKELLKYRRETDTQVSDIYMRVFGKHTGFNNRILSDNRVAPVVTSGGPFYRMHDANLLSKEDFVNIQTFPQDYDFMGQRVQYVCGMSVPPVMMAQISSQVYEQWLKEQ